MYTIKEVYDSIASGNIRLIRPLINNETSGLLVYLIRYVFSDENQSDINWFHEIESGLPEAVLKALKALGELQLWDEQSEQMIDWSAQILFPQE